jgi:predicted dehydrogenase
MTSRLSRRRFLGTLPLGYFFTTSALSSSRIHAANEKLRVAGIGIGGKGNSDITQASKFMDVVAMCDIDDKRMETKLKEFPHAKTYHDYRKLFDEMTKQIDAVTVSTPDHNHCLPSMMAMRAGKHVYCQKPLTHTVFEARLMRQAAAKYGVCTQMGNQGSANNGLRRAVEIVQSGVIGHVKEAHVWTNRPAKYWKQAPDIVARPTEAMEIPKHVHWPEFLGPAPERPYHKAYHPHDWRGFWDFGTGAMGDMACHTANMAFRACKLGAPKTVTAECSEINAETYPAWAHITYTFGERKGDNGTMPPCVLHWYEGKKRTRKNGEEIAEKVLPPQEWVEKCIAVHPKAMGKLVESGSLIIGEKGYIYAPNDYAQEIFLGPAAAFEQVQTKKPEKAIVGVDANQDAYMKEEWVAAIKASKPSLAASHFDFAGRITETMLLGNIALKHAGTILEWDDSAMKFTNSPSATKLIHTEYRKGWDLLGTTA